jgi:peptide/nickel transport system ATP-binding protein
VHGTRKGLSGIPGTPPDLRNPPAGCPFAPRCRHATDRCHAIDMSLLALAGDPGHVSACPFVIAPAQAPRAAGAAGEARP